MEPGYLRDDCVLFERRRHHLIPAGGSATQGEALLHRLRQGPNGATLASLAEAAHGLAGSAGMFGFERLTQAARSFEQAVECKAAGALTLAATLAGHDRGHAGGDAAA